jgi:hypothetical protein
MAEKFEAEEILSKAKSALDELRKNKKPGQIAGEISKIEALTYLKDELKSLLKDGYTAQQIAEQFKESAVFDVLPRYITTVTNDEKQSNKKSKEEKKTIKRKAAIKPVSGVSDASNVAEKSTMKQDESGKVVAEKATINPVSDTKNI